MHRDLPERESMRESQLHRRAAFWTKLLQDLPEPGDPLHCIEISVEFRYCLQLIVRGSLVNVDPTRSPTVEHRMLLREIVGHSVEVMNGIADRSLVADAQHPYVHLLREICGIRLAADAPQEEGLQRTPVLGKQPLDERWLR